MKLALFLALANLVVHAQPTERRPHVVAEGSATLIAQPDEAKAVVTILSYATNIKQSTDDVTASVAAMRGDLAQAFGTKVSVRLTNLDVSQRIPPPIGYVVTAASCEVVLSDLTALTRLAEIFEKHGARLSTVDVVLHDPEPLRTKAQRDATANARTQAEALAAGAGGRLGRILNIKVIDTPRFVLDPFPGNILPISRIALGQRLIAVPLFRPINVTVTVTFEAELIQ